MKHDKFRISVMKCCHFPSQPASSTSPCHLPHVPECLFSFGEWLHTPIILITGGCTNIHDSMLQRVSKQAVLHIY